jgi:hypothetical protein
VARLLIVLALIAAVAVVLYRMRASRTAWIRKLQLPGRWLAETEQGRFALELSGGPDRGTYVESALDDDARPAEEGAWHVDGSALCLRAHDGTEERCDLRAFGDGSIGLDGPRRSARIYRRTAANVVPLRRGP